MLEDESGRLRLIGSPLQVDMLVTGCIIAVMGTENANGEFEVIDIRLPDLAPQPARWSGGASADLGAGTRRKIAIASGLNISGTAADVLNHNLLTEFLLGEALTPSVQASAAQISRLILAGNSLAESSPLPAHEDVAGKKAGRKYGYDSSAYNPAPSANLDELLATLLPSLPITLLPGPTDPANVSLPQQPLHTALFPHSRAYAAPPSSKDEAGWFDSVTNPWQGDVEGWRILATGGQPVDDIFKYVEEEDRLEMMERMLRWRCCAPTAPDTLCMFSSTPAEKDAN